LCFQWIYTGVQQIGHLSALFCAIAIGKPCRLCMLCCCGMADSQIPCVIPLCVGVVKHDQAMTKKRFTS
jgi:hypothetical protein